MKEPRFISTTVCLAMSLAMTSLNSQAVTVATWLQEGDAGHSVSGTGSSFTATPVAITTADDGDNFAVRNLERQRVYQVFDSVIDFSTAGDTIHVKFNVSFAGPINALDSGFRMSLIDTSTNQGFFPIGWDAGTTLGTYNRTRFVDNLDGTTGDAHGGAFNDAINGSGTIASTSTSPIENNGATALGLVDGNMLSFSVVMTRNAGDSFSYTTNATEQNGDVIWAESAGTYDPVNPTSGDTSVANVAINGFDGIVFGLFSDDPYSDYSGDHSYTVSNFSIPEPSSIAFLAISLIGVATTRRRKE